MKAKEFALPDQNGEIRKLSDYRGQWLVVYFYPKDDTPGCTTEACNFRDKPVEGAAVIGISKDSVASHKKFAEKYHLNFPILADPEKEIIKAYGAWGSKKFMGKEFEGTLRTTFLIDPEGNIAKEYKNVHPAGHAKEIEQDLEKLRVRN